jgi:predicted nuclease with TOPRIM domain
MTTEALDSRMARLEGAYERIDKRLATVEGRLANLEAKVDRLDTQSDTRFDILNGKLDRVLWVVVVGLLTTILVNLAI